MLKYFSLFSGVGGFELGIQNSRYGDDSVCVGYSEINPYADSIYRKHFPSGMVNGIPTHIPYGDATEIRTESLPKFDLLVGGFPCQAFSVAGFQRGFSDARGTLFFEIARILKDCRPPYFLLENVRGLLAHEKGQTFKRMLEILSDLGYYVGWEILNSKEYGVPQNRERIFIRGCVREKGFGEILLNKGTSSKVTEKIGGHEYDVVTADYCGDLLPNHLMKINTSRHQAHNIYNPKGVSVALMANAGGMGAKNGLYKINNVSTEDYSIEQLIETVDEDFRIRRLTPLECERVQGFPDYWTEKGVNGELISDTQRYRCMGNAVTTNVVAYIMNNWDLD